jgi:hypothetical protein
LRRYGHIEKCAPDGSPEHWRWQLTDKGRAILADPEGSKKSAQRVRDSHVLTGFDPKRWAAAHEKHLNRQRRAGITVELGLFDPQLTAAAGDRS